MSAEYTVILPYYCEDEIKRYLRIADHIESLGPQSCDYEFLLAASPRAEMNRDFEKRMARIAPVRHFQCPTQIFGYPQGPTAMFWDCMDWMAENSTSENGFGLWFESDMVPVKKNWLDLVVRDWNAGHEQPWIMGCVIPEIYRNRWLKTTPPKWTEEHVNGGACYCRNFANHMPAEAKIEVFDLAVYPYCQSEGKVRRTDTISLSSLKRCGADVAKEDRAVLHGFLQDKNRFIERCIEKTFADVPAKPLSKRMQDIELAIQKLRIKLGAKNEQVKLYAIFAEMDCPGQFNKAA